MNRLTQMTLSDMDYTPPYEQTPEVKDHIQYTDAENRYRLFLYKRIEDARDAREDSHIEFDDNTYTQHYDTNYKTGNAYLRHKQNPQDSRIVTGTTLEKENTFLSAVLSYNFNPTITAYDEEDWKLVSLGDKIESLVKKSRKVEQYDDKRPLIYKEGADQGTWFAEENWVEEWEIQKTLKNTDYHEIKVDKIKWDEKRIKRVLGAQVNLIPGTGVYLGNIKQFFIDKQPFIATRDVISYAEAEACYGNYDRFKYVPKQLIRNTSLETSEIRDWTLEEIQDGFVEVLKYYDKYANEYQLILNGVMMLPVGFPLTAISPSGGYPIAKGDIEPISEFFAYSKSYPAKTKVPQAILDQTIRTMVLRMRQMQEPPLANNTNRVISRKIFYPGHIEDDINPSQLQKILGENNTISGGEFSVYQMVKTIVDEMTMNPIMSGQQSGSSKTATAIMEEKKQSLMKLGYAIYGILSFERQLVWLRIQTLLSHLTKAKDTKLDEVTGELVDVYEQVSVDESDEYGNFTRVIDFNPQGLTKTEEQIQAEADILSTPENKVQKVYLNPKILAEKFLKWTFYVDITPTPKETSEIEGALFFEKVVKAKQIFGPQSTNDPYIKQRMAVYLKEDPEKFWAKEMPQIPQGIPGAPGAPSTPGMDNAVAAVQGAATALKPNAVPA